MLLYGTDWILSNFSQFEELLLIKMGLPTLLPRFGSFSGGCLVMEERGTPLPSDFDPAAHLEGLKLVDPLQKKEKHLRLEEFLQRGRAHQGDVVTLSQHHVDWYLDHWNDTRIPQWFRQAIETGEICLFALDTVVGYHGVDLSLVSMLWHVDRLRHREVASYEWEDRVDHHCRILAPR